MSLMNMLVIDARNATPLGEKIFLSETRINNNYKMFNIPAA
jgi:hypothetical protein